MLKRKIAHVCACGVALWMFSDNFALADEVYAKIRGTVADATGAVIPNVKITATNVGTGVSKTVTSGSDGSYEFLQIPAPATYKVSAQQQGFRSFEATGIQLNLNQVYVLNISLQVGAVTQQVTIEASPAQVETTSMQLGNHITARDVVELPLLGRNWINLQQTIPGAVAASDRFGNFATNGTRSQFNSYMINGTDANDLPLNTPIFIPSPDAIAEVHIITNTINPEYGRDSGAVLNAVTKSGTNSLHGDGFEFYRDTFLNARNFYKPKPQIFHQNLFGATVGGPAWKDHTFFFFSYQGNRNVQPQAGGTVTVFTPDQRNGIFPGIATSTTASPFPMVGEDGATHPAGTPYGTLFPTGHIPSADFNPISAQLLGTYVPLPTSGTEYNFNPTSPGLQDQEVIRIDHNFSAKDSLWGYTMIERRPTTDTLPFSGANLPGFGDINKRHLFNPTLAWNHSFGGTALNEARFGYNRFNFVSGGPQKVVLPSSLGFNINPQDPANAGLPVIAVTGFFTLGFTDSGPQPRIDQTYQFTDNFSKISGRHTFKMGFETRRSQVYNPFLARNGGHFDFAGAGGFSTGDPGADFLLGIPDDYLQETGDIIAARTKEYFTYFQDQFKIRPNFTLTYGITWQVDTPIEDIYHAKKAIVAFRSGEQSTVFPTAPVGMVYPGDKGVSVSGYSTHPAHFGPRFGFAWGPEAGRLTGGAGKTSIRGGFGVYFNRTEEEVTLQNLGNPPYGLASTGVGDVGFDPSFADPWTDVAGRGSIPNKFPFANPSPGDTTIDFSLYEPMSLNIIDPNFTVPYAMNYNLTLEREVRGNTIISLSYVGAMGRKLHTAIETNPLLDQQGCAADPACVGARTVQHAAFPSHSAYPGDIIASLGQQATFLNSNYNAFQASVNKRTSHGLSLQASYTWGHTLDYASSLEDGAFAGAGINPFNIASNYGSAGFDARQRFVVSYVYDLPSVRQFNSFKKMPSRLTDGWEISGITTFQTGLPVEIYETTFRSLTCDAFIFYNCWDRPNAVGALQLSDPRTSSFSKGSAKAKDHYWFNPNAFALEPIGTFGNAGRNAFYGPGINNFDFALYKNVRLVGESKYIQLRFEFYNIFNHTQFQANGIISLTSAVVNGNGASSNFGRILTARDPRLIQFGAKIYF